eukprot:CAMPEP_0194758536 /NCGR_PEP_ID=MMETSP0323_2-20130528/11792_1 /TAXON_ID=2866 ORGANISM="Crypthecodinium cohnii, Strain Seligo" /NCGR_SAMPLE_ID=MMETSP0323_2 /ASSEMBLY_ACC=CAM_ASM_000346 /LENGTH=153 /DNA_ID=CAMNT_0039678909 /DNA_START=69 /DNA_END=531 /DNA_ORIENTATION=+
MAPQGVAIEIHGMADTSSRMNLKKLMEQFGEVIGCHIGNRGVDKPVVRFPSQECAEIAIAALKNQQVWLDGVVLGGDWQKAAPAPEPEAALLTSRDLLSKRAAKAGAEGEEEAGIERKVVAGTKTGDERIEAAAADVEGVEVDERGKAPGECL